MLYQPELHCEVEHCPSVKRQKCGASPTQNFLDIIPSTFSSSHSVPESIFKTGSSKPTKIVLHYARHVGSSPQLQSGAPAYTSCCNLYLTKSAMVMHRNLCCFANSNSCGVLAMEPSSGLTTSHSTPAATNHSELCRVSQRQFTLWKATHSCLQRRQDHRADQPPMSQAVLCKIHICQEDATAARDSSDGITCRLTSCKAGKIHGSFCVAGPGEHPSFPAPTWQCSVDDDTFPAWPRTSNALTRQQPSMDL